MCSSRRWRCCRLAICRAHSDVLLASLILLSSLFHFSDTDSKTEDHCFIGFPAIWNIVAFYVFAFQMPSWVVATLVLACVVLTFVPMRWAHPLRTPLLWPVDADCDGACGAWRPVSRSGRAFRRARSCRRSCSLPPPTASALPFSAAGRGERGDRLPHYCRANPKPPPCVVRRRPRLSSRDGLVFGAHMPVVGHSECGKVTPSILRSSATAGSLP